MDDAERIATYVLERSEVRCPYRRELLIADIATAIRTAVEADRQRVSGAVRGLIRMLPDCPHSRHGARENCPPATYSVDGVYRRCDECVRLHAAPLGEVHEKRYAPALRTLLALLDGDGGRAAKVERVVEAERAVVEAALEVDKWRSIQLLAGASTIDRAGRARAMAKADCDLERACEMLRKLRALDGEGGEG